MPWIKSPSGNVFPLDDADLIAKLTAEGCEVSDEDPRETPKPARGRKTQD